MEITVGHMCPECSSQRLFTGPGGEQILCPSCGWVGTFCELKEVKVIIQ